MPGVAIARCGAEVLLAQVAGHVGRGSSALGAVGPRTGGRVVVAMSCCPCHLLANKRRSHYNYLFIVLNCKYLLREQIINLKRSKLSKIDFRCLKDIGVLNILKIFVC